VNNDELLIVKTGDGSDTLLASDLKEHYHSIFGAIRESRHIFIEQGLLSVPPGTSTIPVLEVGFGTGLNALLTALAAKSLRRSISYHAVDLLPLKPEIWNKLNYPSVLEETDAKEYFQKLHLAPWDSLQRIHEFFTLEKSFADITTFSLPSHSFILIFFDAFSQEIQPELWTEEVFRNMFTWLQPGGTLVTYSCKGIVKQAMRTVGFTIEKLPGPPGKREILRARKVIQPEPVA